MSLLKEDQVNHGSKDDEEKRKLRREIKAWWEGVADHMDLLEEKFSTQDHISHKKALPRLPSTDEAYDSFENEPEEHQTPKAKTSGLPETSGTIAKDYFVKPITSSTAPNLPTPPTSSSISSASLTPTPSRLPMDRAPASATSIDSQLTVTASSSASSIHSTESTSADPMELLSNLRQTFHRTEQSLYTQLAKVPASSLNEVRRSFLSSARGAERRLIAWQKKHLGGKKKKGGRDDKDDSNQLNPSEKLRAAEPQWWNSTCHVVPGGNIIVREDDWGSIIAFTLSTPDYQRELASMSVTRTASTADLRSPDTPIASSTSASSFFSAATATGYKLFRTSALVQPDPDQEDVIWHEPEAYSAVISRKEHPRDATSLLSIREVLRQKSRLAGPIPPHLPPHFSAGGASSVSRTAGSKVILLAPRIIQEAFTSTTTTKMLAEHGLLGNGSRDVEKEAR
ncbi:hypothetical protein BDP27DRAFT_1357191 [Rhodocollybia butyracea]|uniref:Uncharacterized protein n=1 Tax=Rhodocollybia butyracea TaxID=206335 RepID=A0A9P5QA48_9AGAR|nr:hypothetical protein BDP27DRAFT_1357191 [Rhodocollybia butyracea]